MLAEIWKLNILIACNRKFTLHEHPQLHAAKACGPTLLTLPFPPRTWYDPRATLDVQELPPRVVKAMSLIMHSPQQPIHFHHTQSSFLAPQTFLFNSILFPETIRSKPSSQPHTSYIGYYYSLHQPLFLHSHQVSNHLSTFCSVQPVNSLVTPFSFTPPHFSLSPHALLHTYCSYTLSPLHLYSSHTTFKVFHLLKQFTIQCIIHLSTTNSLNAFHYFTHILIYSQIPPPTQWSKFFHQPSQFLLQIRYKSRIIRKQ